MLRVRGNLSASRKPGIDPRIAYEFSKLIRSIPNITNGDQFPGRGSVGGDMHYYTGDDTTNFKKDNWYIRTATVEENWQSMNATSLVPENIQAGTIGSGVKIVDYLALLGGEMLGPIFFHASQTFKPEMLESGNIPGNVSISGYVPAVGGSYVGNIDMTDHSISSISKLYGFTNLVYIDLSDEGIMALVADIEISLTAPTITLAGDVGLTGDVAITGDVDLTGDIFLPSAYGIYFRDTAIYLASLDDGHLDVNADTSLDFNIGAVGQVTVTDGALSPVTTNDIDLGTSSLLYKDFWQTGKHYFRDSAIYAWSESDGWLNLVADTGVEVNAPILNVADLYVAGALYLRSTTHYIDSLADGYIDYRAPTGHRFGDGTNYATIEDTGEITFAGNAGIVLPHLMQSDTTDQAIADVTDEQIITFNTDVHHNFWTRTSSSRFTCTHASSYHIDISACMVGAAGKKIAIWLKKNSTNVATSATYYEFKSTGANTVMTVAFLEHFDVGDYFELWMWGNSTTNKLYTVAAVAASAGVTPAIPACPSIILTVNLAGKD